MGKLTPITIGTIPIFEKLGTISKLENIENIKKLIEKPRLSIFKEIYENKNSLKSSLFEDIKKINKEDIIERIDIN